MRLERGKRVCAYPRAYMRVLLLKQIGQCCIWDDLIRDKVKRQKKYDVFCESYVFMYGRWKRAKSDNLTFQLTGMVVILV